MTAPLFEPGTALGRAALEGPVLEVAPRLLGCFLTHDGVTVRLTEVEAYAGTDDPGSHAYRGPTPRTEVMFGPPGHLYVYLSYGMHRCVNVVTGVAGRASAVLLRAGSVVRGAEQARARREAGRRTPVRDRDLARGPGVLTQALGLGASHHGLDLTAEAAPVLLVAGSGGGAPDPHRPPRRRERRGRRRRCVSLAVLDRGGGDRLRLPAGAT